MIKVILLLTLVTMDGGAQIHHIEMKTMDNCKALASKWVGKKHGRYITSSAICVSESTDGIDVVDVK